MEALASALQLARSGMMQIESTRGLAARSPSIYSGGQRSAIRQMVIWEDRWRNGASRPCLVDRIPFKGILPQTFHVKSHFKNSHTAVIITAFEDRHFTILCHTETKPTKGGHEARRLKNLAFHKLHASRFTSSRQVLEARYAGLTREDERREV